VFFSRGHGTGERGGLEMLAETPQSTAAVKQNGYTIMSLVAMQIWYLCPTAIRMEVPPNLFIQFQLTAI
jgi:hypothetical protein